ncbi:MAG: class I SAM-dependent rRNA methyltransferase [Myxococcales bacterium]|nr:class I SAM-dependent rRNA methyltransferase [Myxococcales bacterium]MCB9709459.1 class I SAM-dependent rRNA methyltransferase [Myxococcales bacterium]
MTTIILRNGHVKPVWAGHPWVYAQAIKAIEGAPTEGSLVRVSSENGRFLGQGFYSPKSAIPVRILSRDPEEILESSFFHSRLERAYRIRRDLLNVPSRHTNAYRLVHSEGDMLGGLIVDVYGDVATAQLLTVGMKQREDDIFAAIKHVTGVRSVLEIARSSTLRREGFEASTRTVYGPEVTTLEFAESDINYTVPLEISQKSGFYLDHRETRLLVRTIAKHKRVLDAFCYLGSFSLTALRGGAESARAIDSSASVLATAATIAEQNGFGGRILFDKADVRAQLPALHARGEKFDVVIIDPPKLAPSTKHLHQGRRAYQKLNSAALRLVATDGLLLTCSCSAALKLEDFLRVLALAAGDAGRQVQVLRVGLQSADHPTLPAFPEGRYLTYALLKVL